jgi:hypothetical protein
MNFRSTPITSALATHPEALEDAQLRPATSNCPCKTWQLNHGSSIVKLERFGRPMEIERSIMGVTTAVDGGKCLKGS